MTEQQGDDDSEDEHKTRRWQVTHTRLLASSSQWCGLAFTGGGGGGGWLASDLPTAGLCDSEGLLA